MRGKVYCIGVGPGDPELMTLKALRVLGEVDAVAVPGTAVEESLAYRIAVQAAPGIAAKRLVPIDMPMTRDRERLAASHRAGADGLAALLDEGLDVAYLTIGDPTVYCTFSHLADSLVARGYEVELVSGVPSFCAAAARAGMPLVLGGDELRVIPAALEDAASLGKLLDEPGTVVLMKAGSSLADLKAALRSSGREAVMIERCGLPDERVYRSVAEMPDEAGYFSLVISRGAGTV